MYIGRHIAFDVVTSSFISKDQRPKAAAHKCGTHSTHLLFGSPGLSLLLFSSETRALALFVLIPHFYKSRG